MSANWSLMKLSEAAEVIGGGTPPTKDNNHYGGDIPWITPKDLSNHSCRYISCGNRSITELGLKKSSAKLLPKGTVLFTSRAPIGYVAIAKNPVSTNQGFKNLVLKENYVPEFFYYLLKANVGIFESRASGSTFNEVSGQIVKDTELKIPPYDTQKRISRILGSLDSKIELNHQINQTLEAIAQAIFKSWFVDFDPVKAKITALESGGSKEDVEIAAMRAITSKSEEELAELKQNNPKEYEQLAQTAALFPSAMQESELGEIPEGWNNTALGKVSRCFDSKRIPLSKRKREEKKPGNIPYYGATSIMDYVNEWIFDDIYLLLGEDGSVAKEDGSPFVQYVWGKSWVNNHAHVLQGRNGVSTEQLMIFIKKQNIAAYVTGAVQLKLNQGNMNSIPFLMAHEGINSAFQTLIAPLFEKVRFNADEVVTLSRLRDCLLPRLLSGAALNKETA